MITKVNGILNLQLAQPPPISALQTPQGTPASARPSRPAAAHPTTEPAGWSNMPGSSKPCKWGQNWDQQWKMVILKLTVILYNCIILLMILSYDISLDDGIMQLFVMIWAMILPSNSWWVLRSTLLSKWIQKATGIETSKFPKCNIQLWTIHKKVEISSFWGGHKPLLKVMELESPGFPTLHLSWMPRVDPQQISKDLRLLNGEDAWEFRSLGSNMGCTLETLGIQQIPVRSRETLGENQGKPGVFWQANLVRCRRKNSATSWHIQKWANSASHSHPPKKWTTYWVAKQFSKYRLLNKRLIFRVYSVISSSMVSGYFNVIVGAKVTKFQVSSGKDIYIYISILYLWNKTLVPFTSIVGGCSSPSISDSCCTSHRRSQYSCWIPAELVPISMALIPIPTPRGPGVQAKLQIPGCRSSRKLPGDHEAKYFSRLW